MSSEDVGGGGSRNQIVVIEDESAAPRDEVEELGVGEFESALAGLTKNSSFRCIIAP